MLTMIKDPASREIQREMAAEWMRLADVARRPSKRWQMQMGRKRGAAPAGLKRFEDDE
jgi:hypothetical protein